MGKRKAETEVIERVLAERTKNGDTQFKVKFADVQEPIWLDKSECVNNELIQKYLKEKKTPSGQESDDETPTAPLKKPKEEKTSSEEDDEDDLDEEFEVEKIVADRTSDEGKTQFKVHWKGYDTDEETWENESNLDCADMIEQYTSSKMNGGTSTKKKPGPKRNGTKANDSPPASPKEKTAEKIVGLHALKNGKREVLIRWKDLSESHDSWEPEENMMGTEIHDNFRIKEKEHLARKEARVCEEEELVVED